MGLFINSCGEVSVNAGDSGSVRFFPKPDGTMTPDKGYHGTLVANRTDNTWDYYSKDGTQYHYKFITQRVQRKLMWVRDRNGNTLTYDYDLNAFPEPVLKAVTHSDGRKLSFSYTSKMVPQPAAGTSQRNMLTEVKGSGDQFVKIEYDDLGNMVSHSVNGRSTNYAYTIDAPNPWDRYRLSSATDAKSDVTSYIYGVHPVNVDTPDGIGVHPSLGVGCHDQPGWHHAAVDRPTGLVATKADADPRRYDRVHLQRLRQPADGDRRGWHHDHDLGRG
ncbi:hypothetical protein PEC18_03420 [Paucibacter sp. O1-1]|nr:hypothetical protein [Paucibacter sp. O1-1]MDA3824927.1 hypothetical protein [Paucibacter sp. O1-1]